MKINIRRQQQNENFKHQLYKTKRTTTEVSPWNDR